MTSDFIGTTIIILVVVLWLLILKKAIVNKIAPVKAVKAEVVDKYQSARVSKFPASFAPPGYIVVFKANDKMLSFAVSQFSYDSYIIKDRGTLKYKGNRIISFE